MPDRKRKTGESPRITEEERLRLLSYVAEQTSEGIALSDLDGNLLFVNKAFASMCGYEPDEILGRHLSTLHTPEQLAAVENAIEQVQTTGDFVGELWHVRRDGTPFVTLMHGTLLRDDNGQPIGVVATAQDITGKKRIEEALRESEQRIKGLADRSFDLIFTLDQDGIITDTNPAGEIITGIPAEKAIGKHFRHFIHPSSVSEVMSLFVEAMKGNVVRSECNLLRADGAPVLVELQGVPVVRDGVVIGVQGNLRDISIHRQAEKALRESEEMYRSLVETSPDAVTATDLDGNITFASGRTLEIHGGKSRQEIIGKSSFDFIAPEDRQRAKKNVQVVLNRGTVRNIEYRLMRLDGTRFDGELSASLVRDAEGNPKGFIATTRDISDRKLAEGRLRLLGQIVEQVTDSVLATDLDYRICYVNPAFRRLFGYSSEDVLGKFPALLNAEPDVERIQNEIYRTVSSGRAYSAVLLNRRKDGSVFPCEVMAFPLMDEQGVVFAYAGSQRDITERKQAEEELAHATRKLEVEHREALEKQAALAQILDHIEQQRQDYKNHICQEIERACLPVLQKARVEAAPATAKSLLDLEANLKAILSRDIDVLQDRFGKLTPRELDICNMIRSGMTSKEISDQLHISLTTVHTHRQQIRKKLGIANQRVNLSTFLRIH